MRSAAPSAGRTGKYGAVSCVCASPSVPELAVCRQTNYSLSILQPQLPIELVGMLPDGRRVRGVRIVDAGETYGLPHLDIPAFGRMLAGPEETTGVQVRIIEHLANFV